MAEETLYSTAGWGSGQILLFTTLHLLHKILRFLGVLLAVMVTRDQGARCGLRKACLQDGSRPSTMESGRWDNEPFNREGCNRSSGPPGGPKANRSVQHLGPAGDKAIPARPNHCIAWTLTF
uniref:Uncharacterized protein n=1 Tax=Knipowitschia caucasica TaxID=637954 RepID=A0AAV2M4L8_KNICA